VKNFIAHTLHPHSHTNLETRQVVRREGHPGSKRRRRIVQLNRDFCVPSLFGVRKTISLTLMRRNKNHEPNLALVGGAAPQQRMHMAAKHVVDSLRSCSGTLQVRFGVKTSTRMTFPTTHRE
jgi:hypothetical protein